MKIQASSVVQELNKPSTYQALIEFDSKQELFEFILPGGGCNCYQHRITREDHKIDAAFEIHPMQCVFHTGWFLDMMSNGNPAPAKPNFPVTPTEMK